MTQVDARYQPQFAQVVRRLETRAQAQSMALRAPRWSGDGQSGRRFAAPANVDARVLDNPAEGYTREVKAALIDAMIENSGPLVLGPDEWLTVAARDNVPRDPLVPGDTCRLQYVIFRLKGSDLAGISRRAADAGGSTSESRGSRILSADGIWTARHGVSFEWRCTIPPC